LKGGIGIGIGKGDWKVPFGISAEQIVFQKKFKPSYIDSSGVKLIQRSRTSGRGEITSQQVAVIIKKPYDFPTKFTKREAGPQLIIDTLFRILSFFTSGRSESFMHSTE